MGNIRGLKSCLCPKCNTLAPHRTFYVRTTIDGKRKWLQLFRGCTRCRSLNHIIVPSYRLRLISTPPPTELAIVAVNALQGGPLDFNELTARLRARRVPGKSHVFRSEVTLTLEFLRDHGMIVEEQMDVTGKALDALRGKPLGVCPLESTKTLVSLYAQKQARNKSRPEFVRAGVFCLSCGHHWVDAW
jgi:hypothetical protein